MSLPSPVAGRVRALVVASIAWLGLGAPGPAARTARAEEASRAGDAAPAGAPAPAGEARGEEVEEIVVLGRRPRGQAAKDPTAAATVVEADRFAGEAKNVAELVATAPGVAVDDFGGLGHLSTVSIRGSTADGVLVLVDGLPLNTAAGGAVDLASIPRHWIERVEVVRGPEGAVYGAGALGGVVNVVTRAPARGRWSAEATAGSFDTFLAGADGTATAGGARLLAAISAESTGGTFPYRYDPQPTIAGNPLVDDWRRNDGVRRGGLLAKLVLRPGATRVDALAQLSAGRRELPGFPWDLTGSDWQEDARALLAGRVATPGPLAGLVLAARGSLRLDRLEARIGAAVADQRGGAAALETEALLERGPALLRLAALAEGEALRSLGLDRTRTRATLAATAAADLFLARGRARIAPAVRAERVGDHAGVSAKLGASSRLAGPLLVRASAGRTFRAPSVAELHLTQGVVDANPELRSELGTGVDAALVVDSPLAFASVGAHATLYRDLVYYEQASVGRLKPFNSGRALVRGVEAELASAPARALLGASLAAAYTFLDSEALRGTPQTLGRVIPHRPRHRLYGRAALAPGRWTAHLEAHVVGRRSGDSRELRWIPRTTSFNAGASLRVLPAVALHLEAKNLLDDRTVVDGYGNPLPSRTVLLTVRAGPNLEGSP